MNVAVLAEHQIITSICADCTQEEANSSQQKLLMTGMDGERAYELRVFYDLMLLL